MSHFLEEPIAHTVEPKYKNTQQSARPASLHSHIYHLSNTRTNLIVFQNHLKSRYRQWAKKSSDLSMSIIIFPLLVPIMFYIAYKIRKEGPGIGIFFQ